MERSRCWSRSAGNVRADQLADALWPRVDADYAHKSFTATLHGCGGSRRGGSVDPARRALEPQPQPVLGGYWALDQTIAELDGALRDRGRAQRRPPCARWPKRRWRFIAARFSR